MSLIPDVPHADAMPHGHQVDLETGLAFINTLEYSKGQPVEHLDSLETAVHWLRSHDLLHKEMVDPELRLARGDAAAAEKRLARIRRVRAAMRELADATVGHRPADGRQVDEVNRALRTHYVY